MGYLNIGECQLFFKTKGEGFPIVFIHGGNMDSRMWDEQVSFFSQHFRVIRYDIRGFGKSTPSRNPYFPADDLLLLLTYLDVPSTNLVGLSLGGTISLEFALSYPEKVKKLVLSGPGLGGYQFSEETIKRQIEILKIAHEEGTEKAVDCWLKDPMMAPAMENPGIAEKIKKICLENPYPYSLDFTPLRSIKPPAISRLREIQAPTLIIVGERDDKEIRNIADLLEKNIPRAKKILIKGAGHILNMEKSEEFNKILWNFLKE